MARDVRMRGFRDRSEVEELVSLLDARLTSLSPAEIALSEAADRILAVDVIAEIDVPAFNRAAMDGYALRGSETFGAGEYNSLELTVVGESFPGRAFRETVQPGQAVRIMTGAPVPAGADAVLQAEAADEREGRVRFTEAVPPGRNVGTVGEDIRAGTIVLKAGRRLRPQDLGVLASIGYGRVMVVRQPLVVILITGNELLPCGSKPEGCRIVDSNSVMMAALVWRDGGRTIVPPILRDDPDSIRGGLEAAIEQQAADMVLVSGGSSVGQEDHAPRLVAELGELPIHGVALRPASPAGVGFIGGRPVFLMPGNPVSCLCAYDLFAGRAVRRLGGRSPEMPYRAALLPLARKLSSAIGRVDYVRVQVRDGQVEPLATSGASVLSSTTRADGFVLVPRDSEGYPPGEVVRVFFYD